MRATPLCVCFSLYLMLTSTALRAEPPQRVYVGTYTGADSQGIYLVELDRTTGQLGAPTLAAEVKSPSFLTLHHSRPLLYACSEVDDFDVKKAGCISAFIVEKGFPGFQGKPNDEASLLPELQRA